MNGLIQVGIFTVIWGQQSYRESNIVGNSYLRSHLGTDRSIETKSRLVIV